MVISYFSPSWFRGVDIMLEFSFFLISLLITLFAYKIYKETSNRSVKYFWIGFLFISIGNFILTIFNFLIILNPSNLIFDIVVTTINDSQVTFLELLGLYSHIISMIIGLSFLVYTTLKDKNTKTLILIIILSLTGTLLNDNNLYMFYLFSTILLGFILWHYIMNFIRNKKIETLLVTIAFVFLFFGNFHFLIAVNHEVFYVIGHTLEFFAYLLILGNLLLIRRK